ncbi:MAG: glycosyltransferase [Candidatus Thermoplasmatota archaeon]|nr:glycosyltransferase [Candidatus Thermoplasmatota archaeon]
MPKKIIVSGCEFHSYVYQLVKGAQDAGYIAKQHYFLLGHDGSLISILQHYSRVLFKVDQKKRYSESLEKIMEKECPDILLIIKGDLLLQDSLKNIRKTLPNLKIVLWLLDSIKNIDLYNSIFEDIDIVAFFEKSDLDSETSKIIKRKKYLPMAYDPLVYYPMNLEKKYDVTFCGALYPNRIPILRYLSEKGSKYKWRIGIVGCAYRMLPFSRFNFSRKEPLIYRNIIARCLSPAQVNQLYNQSVAVLNIHHDQNILSYNPRTIEILGSGSCQLLDHKSALDGTFPNRECVMYYEKAEDLVQKLLELFKSDKLRETLRRNAVQHVKKHTFEVRISELINELN